MCVPVAHTLHTSRDECRRPCTANMIEKLSKESVGAFLVMVRLLLGALTIAALIALHGAFPPIERPATASALFSDLTTVFLPAVPVGDRATGGAITFSPNYSIYTDYFCFFVCVGKPRLVGEITNDTRAPIFLVSASVNFFDGAGRIVDTASGIVPLNVLASGDRACFSAEIPDPARWARLEFDSVNYSAVSEPSRIIVSEANGRFDSELDQYQVVGLARNDGQQHASYGVAVMTLYNNVGTVVGCNGSSLNNRTLPPGGVTGFKIATYRGSRNAATFARFRVQVS